MNCGSFKIYTKKGTRSVTVNGGAWKSSEFSNKPTNLNLSNKWYGVCCGKVDDNAISITGIVNMDNGRVEFTQVNHYSGSITTTSRWSSIIIEFLN